MNKLYLGIKSHVVCLDKRTGNELWRTKIKLSALTNVVVDGDLILAYSGGHLFGLNAETGAILWENKLPGLGHGYGIIATAGNQDSAATAAAQQIQAQQAAAAAATTATAAAASSSS